MFKTHITCISVWYPNMYRADKESVRMYFHDIDFFDDEMTIADVVAFVIKYHPDANSFIAYNGIEVCWNRTINEAKSIIERMNNND